MNFLLARFTWAAACGLACSLPSLLAADEVADVLSTAAIAPWITDDTVLVAQIDLQSVDPQATGEALTDLLAGLSDNVPAQQAHSIAAAVASWVRSAQDAGVRNVLAVARFSPDLFRQSPLFLVLPNHPGLKRDRLPELFGVSDQSPLKQIERVGADGPIVIGAAGLLQDLQAKGRGDAETFETALAAVGEFPIRLAFSFTDDQRRVFREMAPQLPAPLSAWDGKTLADGVLWKAVGIQLSPTPQIRAEIESLDAESSRQLLTAWRELSTFIIQRTTSAASVNELTSLAKQIAPARQESRLRFAFDANAIRLLLRQLDDPTKAARAAAARSNLINQVRQLALAHLNYESAKGHLPDCAIRAEDGKPLLSWRVTVLPYLEETALFEQFHLDEPWDSPHNSKLIDKMPAVYRMPAPAFEVPAVKTDRTPFLVPVGEGLIFGQPGGIKIRDIRDGTSRTLLIVTVPEDQAVIWTKPADWEVDLDRARTWILPAGRAGFAGALCDSSTRWFDASLTPEKLRALLTINGREVVD